ncbi:MAG: hypothetical protein ACRYFW_04135 [Janthinobacterium lividum]
MADDADVDVAALTERMRRLSDDDRHAAIDAALNVVGFSRFTDVAHQRDLSDGYRRPRGGGAS